MKAGWRWFGPADAISLREIRQAGVTDVVTSLYDQPVGAVWPLGRIRETAKACRDNGMTWSVVESVPVHEDVKKRTGDWRKYVENYKKNLRSLAKCGVKVVCYNFMPVHDWARTDLHMVLPDGSVTLAYDQYEVCAFEMFVLKRPGVENDYDAAKSAWLNSRGESVDAPENTLPAYKTAVERGFGFECDVYLSKDGRVFTFHDRDLKRTSGGVNKKKCADAMWAGELENIDVGSWGKWKGSKFAGTRPALLEEVLALARDGRWLYIDVKSKTADIVPHVKAIFDKQKKANPKNTLFLCGSLECGKAFKKLMPEYKVLSCLNCCRGWENGAPPEPVENIISTTREMGADGVDLRFVRDVTTSERERVRPDCHSRLPQ